MGTDERAESLTRCFRIRSNELVYLPDGVSMLERPIVKFDVNAVHSTLPLAPSPLPQVHARLRALGVPAGSLRGDLEHAPGAMELVLRQRLTQGPHWAALAASSESESKLRRGPAARGRGPGSPLPRGRPITAIGRLL